MEKRCKCGQTMDIRLRTVIFQNRVQIENVPVYVCESCNRTAVHPAVKDDLTGFIGKLDDEPGKQHIYFEDINEFAQLLLRVPNLNQIHDSLEELVEGRINELLDLLLLAQSLHDDQWTTDIRNRLSQIANSTSVFDFS